MNRVITDNFYDQIILVFLSKMDHLNQQLCFNLGKGLY